MKKTFGALTVALLAAVAALYIAGVADAQKTAPSSESKGFIEAADFSLTDIDGKPIKLSDYRGKVVILDFWATWCPPCVREIPHFNALYKKYGEKGLVVLGVSVDQDGAKAVKEFKAKNPLNYRVALSEKKVYDQYQGYLPKDERGGIPFTFIIDRKGNIRQHYVGYRDIEVFDNALKGLL